MMMTIQLLTLEAWGVVMQIASKATLIKLNFMKTVIAHFGSGNCLSVQQHARCDQPGPANTPPVHRMQPVQDFASNISRA